MHIPIRYPMKITKQGLGSLVSTFCLTKIDASSELKKHMQNEWYPKNTIHEEIFQMNL